jgi:hypothetical protein
MVERRPLTDGLKPSTATVDPKVERDFVFQSKDTGVAKTTPAATQTMNRVPISTRIRSDFAAALKRASLERQLNSVEPNTLQDILEQAIEPWLTSNGYMP